MDIISQALNDKYNRPQVKPTKQLYVFNDATGRTVFSCYASSESAARRQLSRFRKNSQPSTSSSLTDN